MILLFKRKYFPVKKSNNKHELFESNEFIIKHRNTSGGARFNTAYCRETGNLLNVHIFRKINIL